jgi:hypothetical protein
VKALADCRPAASGSSGRFSPWPLGAHSAGDVASLSGGSVSETSAATCGQVAQGGSAEIKHRSRDSIDMPAERGSVL